MNFKSLVEFSRVVRGHYNKKNIQPAKKINEHHVDKMILKIQALEILKNVLGFHDGTSKRKMI